MMSVPPRICGPTDTDLAEYLRQIRAVPLLTPEEERELSLRYRRSACEQSRERLICANLRLVVYAAKRYAGLGVPLQDLVEAGNLGLLHAVERFDPDKGARFATFALWWIKRAVSRVLADHGCVVRVPDGRQRVNRICRAIAERLSAELGRRATDEEVARAAGLPLKAVRWAGNTPRTVAPATDDAGHDAMSVMCDERAERPDEALDRQETRQRVRACLGSLPSQEAEIIRLHYGLSGREPLTIKDISRELGLASSRATRLLEAGLERLQLMLGREPRNGSARRRYAAG